MASVTLPLPDLALFADVEATRVQVPHLVAADRTRGQSVALVTFEGDQHPTPFRGEARSLRYSMTARFGADDHDDMAALLQLLELAQDAPDGRIQYRPAYFAETPWLQPLEVVTVTDLAERHLGRRAWDVVIGVERVAFTVEV